VFGNLIGLNDDQVEFLEYQAQRKRLRKPLYVCELQGSNIVEGKAKMVNKILLQHLSLFLPMHKDNPQIIFISMQYFSKNFNRTYLS
jgi:hypothetical protein